MSTHLTDVYTADELNQLIRSWLAYSATNIIFAEIDGKVELLLGIRTNPAESIPEPGDHCLIGGFNHQIYPSPSMLADVADGHAVGQLGIRLEPGQCSPFLACEYDMAKILGSLKTPYGEVHIKRVAFVRMVMLDADQVTQITPQGKINAIRWVTREEFEALAQSGELSFPHQLEHVRKAFVWARDGDIPRNVSWTY